MRNTTLTEGDKAFQLMQLDYRQVGIDLSTFDNESTPNLMDLALYPPALQDDEQQPFGPAR